MAGKQIDPLAFPGFRLILEIAEGRLGTVWRARELESQELVALKVYRPEVLRRTGFVSGLDAAVLAARGFSHPAAARVLGLAEDKAGGGLALVMELVGGEVLERALQRNVRFAADRALHLARQMAECLAAAGAHRLVAGHLHPGRAVISGESVKLLGLGSSAIEGLPERYDHAPEEGRFAPAAYAAPEVLSGAAPDPRSDVFALAAVLYHMFTGLPAFRARDMAGLKLERAEGLRWPRGADSVIPPEALGLVGRALELDPALRPTAAEFAASAGRILAGATSAAQTAVVGSRFSVFGATDNEPPTTDNHGEKTATRPDLKALAVAGAPSSPPPPPAPRGSTEILPGEPSRLAWNAPRPAAGAARLRDALLGALAAALLLAAGALLGRYLWQPPSAPLPAGPPSSVEAPPRPREPEHPTAPAASEAQAAQEYEAVLAVLAEKPANLEPLKARLEAIARRNPGGKWGLLAEVKLGELRDEEKRVRAERYRRLLESVGELERNDRFGEAAALLEKLPAELAGTDLAPRAGEEAAALRKRAAERYARIAAAAERSVADGDPAAAMLDYKRVTERFGLDEPVTAAARRLAELGRIQEDQARKLERQKEEQRLAGARGRLRAALSAARSQAAGFRYDGAREALNKIAADADQPEENRALAKSYLELLESEKKLFALAGKRIADGVAKLNIRVGASEELVVTRMDEKGLVADGTDVKGLVFGWERIPPEQAYNAVKLPITSVDPTDGEKFLPLATFAFHRGRSVEVENCLKLAGELDAALKGAAEKQAAVYRQVEELLGKAEGK